MSRPYLWKSPYSYLFPRPYVPEELKVYIDHFSPFPYSIDMEKETTKSTAISVMKHMSWQFEKREAEPFLDSNGDDFFAVFATHRKRKLEENEQRVWDEAMLAVKGLQSLKRAKCVDFDTDIDMSSTREKKRYRKTPPFNPSLRKCLTEQKRTPSPSSFCRSSFALPQSERTSPSKTSVAGH